MSKRTSYRTFGRAARVKLDRKGSRFIGIGAVTKSPEELEEARESIEGEFPDATHVCSGSVIVENDRPVSRYENDGEPSGTAGKPILGVITGEGLENCAIFVVRYYGGTNLGTGGLVRAYSGAARAVVEESEIVVRKPRVRIGLEFDYNRTGKITEVLSRFDGVEVLDRDYGETLRLEVSVGLDQKEPLVRSLVESTSNEVKVTDTEDR